MYQSAGHSNKLTNKFVKKYWLLLLKMIEPTEIVIFGNKDNQHCNTRILSKEKLNLSYFKFGTTHTHTHIRTNCWVNKKYCSWVGYHSCRWEDGKLGYRNLINLYLYAKVNRCYRKTIPSIVLCIINHMLDLRVFQILFA